VGTHFQASSSRQFRTLDQEFAAIAQRAPGFAGMFFDQSGDVVISVAGPVDSAGLVASIALAEGGSLVRPRKGTRGLPNLRFRSVEYDYRTLVTWKQLLWSTLEGQPITLVDIDEVRNRLRIGLSDMSAAPAVTRRLESVGIPAAALIIEFAAPAELTETVRDRFRPVPGAVQVQEGVYLRFCTITANAITDLGPGFVTSSHCTWRYGGVYDGTTFHQNVYYDPAGFEAADGELLQPGTPSCPSTVGDRVVTGCRYSDAAFILYSGVSGQQGTIARTLGIFPLAINPNHPRFLLNEPPLGFLIVGDEVHKIGRTTGWTTGQVTSTCFDAAPGNIVSEGVLRTYVLLCQYQASYGNQGGDSGAPVFTWDGTSDFVDLWGINTGNAQGQAFFGKWLYVDLELNSVVGVLDVAY
jgi:hypothetical protein